MVSQVVRVWKRAQYLGTKDKPHPLRRGDARVLFGEPREIWKGLGGGGSSGKGSRGSVSAAISFISISKIFCPSRSPKSLIFLSNKRRCLRKRRVFASLSEIRSKSLFSWVDNLSS